MGENLEVEGRRSVRTPMQWTPGPAGGFSTADPGDLRRPPPTGDYAPDHVNVADQQGDEGSLLTWFARMIRRRRTLPALGWGAWEVLDVGAASVLAIRHDLDGVTLVTLHNLAGEPAEVALELSDVEWDRAQDLLGSDPVPSSDHRLAVTLDGFGHRWFRLDRREAG